MLNSFNSILKLIGKSAWGYLTNELGYTMIAGLIGQGVGGGMQTAAAGFQARDQNKKIKNAMSDYPYSAYSGYKPPRIDTEDTKILRPTQKQLFDILMSRSKGEDVGYAPEWMTKNTDLIKSELGRQEEDQLRSAKGSLSAAGLSGNPRAYEATAGRVKRDVGRSLTDSLTALSISDLERKNEERDVNTARLQDLNTFNFGQENTAAEFDLNQWKAEESAKQGRTGLGLTAAEMYRNPLSAALSTWGSSLQNTGSSLMGGSGGGGGNQPVVQTYSSSPSMSSSALRDGGSGQGLNPTSLSTNRYESATSLAGMGNRYGRNLKR